IAESDIKMSAGGLRLHFKTSEPGSTEPGSLVVQGDLESLLPFVSPDHREGLRTQSKGVQVFVHAEGSALSAGLAHVKATAELRDPVDGALHALHSTFDLEKSSAPAHRASSSSRSSYEQCADAMAFCGLKLSHGAFWAKSLPIARYLAPCLSTRQSMTAQGLFDLSGTFEGGHIIARFNARDIALDSPSLHLELPSVGQRGADPSDYDAFAGVYHLDFLRDQNYGYFPLHGARLSLKNSGASFDALEGSVSLEGQELFVKKLSTEADGVHIEGRLRLDVAPCAGRNAQIEIHTDRIEGKLSDATRLLERFSQGRRSTLPLDGRLLCERPAFIRLQIEDAGVGVEAQVQGELLDGVLSFDIPGVQVEGIATEFAYDHQRRTLAFPKLRGRILVGNGAQVDEYTLRARHLRVYGFPDSQADFDLRIEGRTRDLVRLVGNTAMAPEFGRDAIHIAFDRAHTYFGTIQPNVNRLVLKNWKELLEFHAEPTANVANLIGDLERIARSGSFICGPEFFAHLRDHDVAGEAITTVSRSAGSQQTTFDIRGDQIRFDGHSFSSVQIAGRLEPGHWTVDQLQLDELNVSAELRAHENGTRVDFLGLRYGDALLAGMEGEYKSEAGSFEGLVNVLDIDLSKAEALPGFPSELIGAGLTGRIHAKGIAKADLMAEAPYIRCGARLESDLKQFSIFSVPFSPSKGLVLQVQSDRGLSIEQSAIAVDHQHLGLAPLGILVDRVHYDFQTESLEVNGAQFRIPAKNLPWLASTLHAHCPKIVNTKRQEMISQLLSSGQLQGSLSFEAAPTVHSWAIELAEGEYHFANDTHY
ncbi:MAG: hypothetical protein KDK78_05850, partial [Chlamydiia bacterium]|nr:hypothetical protein [Chlamydiia bacterium]